MSVIREKINGSKEKQTGKLVGEEKKMVGLSKDWLRASGGLMRWS